MSETEPLLRAGAQPSANSKSSSKTKQRLVALVALLVSGALFFSLLSMLRVPQMQPLSRVAQLPAVAKLDPANADQRIILVGDVHGMYKELRKLLKKVDYDEKQDTLVLLGDLITKGYDSLDVVDFAIKNNAYCVRGNHEDEILSMYAKQHHLSSLKTYPPHATPTAKVAGQHAKHNAKPTIEPTKGPDFYKDLSDKERDGPLVKGLKKRHIRYLTNCPAILRLGQISRKGIEAVAVHGGLLWHEHNLEDQDVLDVLRIRSIVPPDYERGSEDPDEGDPWFDKWEEEQRDRPKSERFEVFYGHDASKGLQLHRYSKGLDTRCQRGGQLSAYVVTVSHEGHYHEKLVQIDC